jgi:hypothetical protein
MASFHAARPAMLDVQHYRARRAAREFATRLVLALLLTLAALVIGAMLYVLATVADRGLAMMGGEMKAYADSQTGAG